MSYTRTLAAFEWVDVGSDLVMRAMAGWIERFPDQRLSLTDAMTLEAMRESRITSTFASDQDFVTAGFAGTSTSPSSTRTR